MDPAGFVWLAGFVEVGGDPFRRGTSFVPWLVGVSVRIDPAVKLTS